MSGHYPGSMTVDDIPDALHPAEMGLSLSDWLDADPDAFVAAARDCVDGDDVMDVVIALMLDRPVTSSPRWRERMNRKLYDLGNARPAWVVAWVNERTGD